MKYCARISRIWEVASFAVLIGFDRAFHPAASLVTVTYRELSALTEGFGSGLALAVLVPVLAIGLAFGTRLIARLLPTSGLSDIVRSDLASSAEAPVWWPLLILIHDIAAAISAAWRLNRSALPKQASVGETP